MIGFQELGLDTDQVIEHFNEHLGERIAVDHEVRSHATHHHNQKEG